MSQVDTQLKPFVSCPGIVIADTILHVSGLPNSRAFQSQAFFLGRRPNRALFVDTKGIYAQGILDEARRRMPQLTRQRPIADSGPTTPFDRLIHDCGIAQNWAAHNLIDGRVFSCAEIIKRKARFLQHSRIRVVACAQGHFDDVAGCSLLTFHITSLILHLR
jgi:hypothetical protein